METSIIAEVHNELAERIARGDEKGALEYLKNRFSELPEEVQGGILTLAYLNAVEEEVERTEIIGHIQARAIGALKALEAFKKELEKKEGTK